MAPIDLTSHNPLCAALSEEGFDVYNVEYRRTGSARRPEDTLADARRAVEDVVKRVGRGAAVLGHSAGGYLAESVANVAGVALTVSLAPLTDLWRWGTATSPDALLAWLGGASVDPEGDARRLSLNPRRRVSSDRVLLHGSKDAIVPCSISQHYAGRVLAARRSIDLGVVADEGHFAFIDPTQPAFELVTERFERWRSHGA